MVAVTKPGDELPANPPAAEPAEPGAQVQPGGRSGDRSQSTSRMKALTELDEPDFEYRRNRGPEAAELPRPSAANDNLRAEGLATADFTPLPSDSAPSEERAERTTTGEQAIFGVAESDDLAEAPGAEAAEPNLSTRADTHVAEEAWFDATLGDTPSDPKLRLAWRFRAAFSAYRLLLPNAPTAEARALMINALRRYERLLRRAAGAADDANRAIEGLHALLSDQQAIEIDRALSEFEGALLTLDECLPETEFQARFTTRAAAPKLLLRYARFLAARTFDVGYRRERFEALALELLATRLPSGKLRLLPRQRSGQVLVQLLRGLTSPTAPAEPPKAQIAYLLGALDRLENIAGSKQFFDGGFYLDVCGYKISKHAHILSPEFLYLCAALDVEIHNRMHAWSETASDGRKPGGQAALAELQAQLRAQHAAAQAVFPDFHRSIGAQPVEPRSAPGKTTNRRATVRVGGAVSWLRFGVAGAFLLAALAVNLFTTGLVRLDKPPEVLSLERLQDLSPLLIGGRVTEGGKRFVGSMSRPKWRPLNARQRQNAASELAQALKARGIERADILAYKDPAIRVEFGSVVFVDLTH